MVCPLQSVDNPPFALTIDTSVAAIAAVAACGSARFARSVEVVNGAMIAFISGGTARTLGASQVGAETNLYPAGVPNVFFLPCMQYSHRRVFVVTTVCFRRDIFAISERCSFSSPGETTNIVAKYSPR